MSLPSFFFNDTATTEIYTLSLHDALPISYPCRSLQQFAMTLTHAALLFGMPHSIPKGGLFCTLKRYTCPPSIKDRKSTRLNSSHANISYAVFCLKKKKNITYNSRSSRNCH